MGITRSECNRWLSADFTALLEQQLEGSEPYDAVVVGTGYGGAMAACELAGSTIATPAGVRAARVCVLERGKEYVPGAFPSSLKDLPGHVRFHRQGSQDIVGTAEGLLDFRASQQSAVLLGNGLGGGSLINAGVLEVPKWSELAGSFPVGAIDDFTPGFMQDIVARLGGEVGGIRNDIQAHPDTPEGTPKTRVMRSVGAAAFRPATLSIAMRDEVHSSGVALKQCVLCGDCLTGCNAGAKKSLDTNLLAEARRHGAEIYTGASVTRVVRDGHLWSVEVVYTHPALRERHAPLHLTAHKVILAAGALGSTEILLRSASPDLRFSKRLGAGFSGNGDTAVLIHKMKVVANSAPSPERAPWDRGVGPTITGVVDLAATRSRKSLLLQELSIPAALRRVFEEIVTSASLLDSLGRKDPVAGDADGYAVNDSDMERSMLLGVVGHDRADGELALDTAPGLPEGCVHVQRAPASGPGDAQDSLDEAVRLVRRSKAADAGTVISPNPFWRGLPESLTLKPAPEDGPGVTVHPLGGCPMADAVGDGVVDAIGRVFDGARPGTHHDGLVVLDGSILPCSLAANPAVAIAAIACRSARALRASWGWSACASAPAALPDRPQARMLEETWTPPRPTRAEINERLVGEVVLHDRVVIAELTLCYEPFEVRSLFGFEAQLRTRAGSPARESFLRLFDKDTWTRARLELADDATRAGFALVRARVQASLRLERDRDPAFRRAARSIPAWLMNRGVADLLTGPTMFGRRPLRSLSWLWHIASRAGEVRRLVYAIDVQEVTQGSRGLLQAGDRIEGLKRFTYTRRASPLRQLTELQIHRFPNAVGSQHRLKVDGRFLVRTPFIQLAEPQDFTVAIADFAALGMYLARVAAGIHLWSFRLPLRAAAAPACRLPGKLPGLPAPEVHEIVVAPRVGDIPVVVRLTRYARARDEAAGPPLLMIHGYSASGTTFAHPALPTSMAAFFWRRRRDVWVVDLRTSAGLASAGLPWNFEEVAASDVPAAILEACRISGAERVDVFAHCIGAVMLSMTLLAGNNAGASTQLPAPDIAHRIRRVVLSQKAPALIYSEGNLLRAYLFRRLRPLLPPDFQFDVSSDGFRDRLIDRILTGTLSYPDEDYDRETSPATARRATWAGFRRRMDALYARDFSLRDIPDETLAAVRDLFGPLNLDTVAQAMHFVERDVITNAVGQNVYVTADALRRGWRVERTLSVHGADNGLVSAHTAAATERLMQMAGIPFQARVFEGFGHQDLLIGSRAHEMFDAVEEFLR